MYEPAKDRWLPREGAIAGAKMGLVLCLGYIVWSIVRLTVEFITEEYYLPSEGLGGVAAQFFFVALFGVLIAGPPSVILGALTGWIMGKRLMQRASVSRVETMRLALQICLAFAVPGNVAAILLLQVRPDPVQSGSFYPYITFLAVPSIIYVLGGVWMGARWHRLQFGKES
ncbi:MAG TPA: hypothetical protein VF707_02550 [Ardenticatenaceae bacterium]|jgi:hypothetical protein